MNAIFVTILFLFCNCTISLAQMKNDLEYNNIKGKVKLIVTYQYTVAGKKYDKDKSDTVLGQVDTVKYDDHGFSVYESTYQSDSKKHEGKTYFNTYNSLGQRIKKTYVLPEQNGPVWDSFVYLLKSRKMYFIRSDNYYVHSAKSYAFTIYEYNKHGRESVIKKYNEYHLLREEHSFNYCYLTRKRMEYIYNCSEYQGSDFKDSNVYVYKDKRYKYILKYNNRKDIIVDIQYEWHLDNESLAGLFGKKVREMDKYIISSYSSYDRYGNWQTKIWHSKRPEITITKRQIVYY